MSIGRRHHWILDCADPDAAAAFWSALLGEPITYRDAEFVLVAADERSSGMAFQRAPGHRAPTWPDPAVSQQVHVDVMVEDVAAACEVVRALGARHFGGNTWADPAGHPFCLIRRPGWAAPLEG